MTGIEKQAAFYRAYLIDDRSLAPLATAWATIVGLWLLVYLVSAIGGAEANQADGRGSRRIRPPLRRGLPCSEALAGVAETAA